MFWLSHHHAEEWNRTYLLGGLRICARCLGTYPTLFVAIALQLAIRAPLALRWDIPAVLLLTLPALLDWARGRFQPAAASNGFRTLTGICLGAALGRTLYVHLRAPWPPMLIWQGVLVLSVALPVLAMAWKRKHR